MIDDLTAWLRGVLDEDEAVAERAARFPYDVPEDAPWLRAELRIDRGGDTNEDRMMARFGHPARVLADIAAKRAILDAYEGAKRFYSQPDRDPYRHPDKETNGLGQAIHHIASAYADRPGYREQWRP